VATSHFLQSGVATQVVVESKVSIPSVHKLDVNMANTKNKVIMFKDKEPIKKKSTVDWEEEQKL
jgi:hypothetical protein